MAGINSTNVAENYIANPMQEARDQNHVLGYGALAALLGGGAGAAYLASKQLAHTIKAPGIQLPKKRNRLEQLYARVQPGPQDIVKAAGLSETISGWGHNAVDGVSGALGQFGGKGGTTYPSATAVGTAAIGLPLAFFAAKGIKNNIDEMYRGETSEEKLNRYKRDFQKLLEADKLDNTPHNMPFKKVAAYISAVEDMYLEKNAGDFYADLVMSLGGGSAVLAAYHTLKNARKYDENKLKDQAAQEAFNRHMLSKPTSMHAVPAYADDAPDKWNSLSTANENIIPIKATANSPVDIEEENDAFKTMGGMKSAQLKELSEKIASDKSLKPINKLLIKAAVDLENLCRSAEIDSLTFAQFFDSLDKQEKVAFVRGDYSFVKQAAGPGFHWTTQSAPAILQDQNMNDSYVQAALHKAMQNPEFMSTIGAAPNANYNDVFKATQHFYGPDAGPIDVFKRNMMNPKIDEAIQAQSQSPGMAGVGARLGMDIVNPAQGLKDAWQGIRHPIDSLHQLGRAAGVVDSPAQHFDSLAKQAPGFDPTSGYKSNPMGEVQNFLKAKMGDSGMQMWQPVLASLLFGGGALAGHPLIGAAGGGLALMLPYIWQNLIQPYMAQNGYLGEQAKAEWAAKNPEKAQDPKVLADQDAAAKHRGEQPATPQPAPAPTATPVAAQAANPAKPAAQPAPGHAAQGGFANPPKQPTAGVTAPAPQAAPKPAPTPAPKPVAPPAPVNQTSTTMQHPAGVMPHPGVPTIPTTMKMAGADMLGSNHPPMKVDAVTTALQQNGRAPRVQPINIQNNQPPIPGVKALGAGAAEGAGQITKKAEITPRLAANLIKLAVAINKR